MSENKELFVTAVIDSKPLSVRLDLPPRHQICVIQKTKRFVDEHDLKGLVDSGVLANYQINVGAEETEVRLNFAVE